MEPFVLKHKPKEHFSLPSWEQLSSKLAVGFTTRNGGVSQGIYKSNNLALHVGDQVEDVVKNRENLSNVIGFPFQAWTAADQVHGNHVEVITEELRGKGRLNIHDTIQQTDAMVTNVPGILLTSYYADCVPLYFYDPVKQVVGLAHAGWKGTVLKIGKNMIEVMKQTFQSFPNDIRVVIGPSIGKCCYEVDHHVINPIQSSFQFITPDMIMDKKNGHFDLDLKEINKEMLIKEGILAEHIEISTWCTSCNTHLFFSHRKERGQTGRMASWIGLKEG